MGAYRARGAHWAKGIDEPLRVYYDVGLGREFAADELQAEQPLAENGHAATRIGASCAPGINGSRRKIAHAIPSRHLSDRYHGAGRVGRLARPGAEYDLDPLRIERQAASSPAYPARKLRAGTGPMGAQVRREMPVALADLAHQAQDILANVDKIEA